MGFTGLADSAKNKKTWRNLKEILLSLLELLGPCSLKRYIWTAWRSNYVEQSDNAASCKAAATTKVYV
jgi:hypothetical protein